jgi:hypothetical protein
VYVLFSNFNVSFRLVRRVLASISFLFCLTLTVTLSAATGGSISGTVTDPSGAVVRRAVLKLVNTAQQTTYKAVTNAQGLYSLPNLPVGRYDLTISADGSPRSAKPT